MSQYRITWDILASGQPRPYADSRRIVKVSFEHETTYGPEKGQWKPAYTDLSGDSVRAILRAIPCGFTDTPPADWASDRLAYLRQESPGVWKFQIDSPYTD